MRRQNAWQKVESLAQIHAIDAEARALATGAECQPMNIILASSILGFLVAIHEFGHFVVAKISGMYVTTFSIGMGPKIASFQRARPSM